jgi:hypothetical protein
MMIENRFDPLKMRYSRTSADGILLAIDEIKIALGIRSCIVAGI